MRPHHEAWLALHPNRDEGWLQQKLNEGFDVHHLDGVCSNNDPVNLALVYGPDHAKLHDMPFKRRAVVSYALGKDAYEAKADNGYSWEAIAELCGLSPMATHRHAKRYALHHNLPWPLPRSVVQFRMTRAQRARVGQ